MEGKRQDWTVLDEEYFQRGVGVGANFESDGVGSGANFESTQGANFETRWIRDWVSDTMKPRLNSRGEILND